MEENVSPPMARVTLWNGWNTRLSVGAVPEVVAPDVGILVPPRDPPRLAQAILELLDDPGRREKLGQAGRVRMERHFSWQRCGERTAAIYADVLSGAPGGKPLSFDADTDPSVPKGVAPLPAILGIGAP